MKSSECFSVLEWEQIEKVKRIGELHGDSPELKKSVQETYTLYRSGKISAQCYEKIYSSAFDHFQMKQEQKKESSK